MAGRKDENGLTPKRLAFCRAYIETGNASEAYRRSFSSANMKADTVKTNAYKLLQDTHVLTTIDKLRADSAERHELTVDDLVAELEEARKTAKETGQPASMVSATMGKGKLLGMVVDRKEVTVHGMISGMTDAELASFIEEIDVDGDDYAPEENSYHST